MIIHGRNTVAEALKLNIVKHLFLRKGSTFEYSSDVPVEEYGRKEFDHRFGGEAQGIAAEINDIEPKEFVKERKKIQGHTLILDRIQDPHNYGTIIRAANCFGVKNFVVARYHQSPITAAVCKASSGTIFHANIYETTNISNAAADLKKQGFTIYAADVKGETRLKDVEFSEKSAVILGSEGKGIRPGVLENADVTFRIQIEGDIDSLNVSQSAAVIMYSLQS
ncbi:TrmH family RNA methyltransferase [Limisalsivibrio acetivorans]|uniref:TrmH family RNA methyltransferase n=1 Tax=Limisalsivibrio acetivorans TaxID=1304888 RepID=UPI0003B43ADF|nr:RNA methyltransferase [Limisalsivibrio acetivorans]